MKNFLVLIFIFVGFSSFAAHIIGGEVYYDYLGNDEYKITFEIYRDCNGAGAAFDNPLSYTVFSYDGSPPVEFLASPVIDVLPIVYDDPCVTPPNDICVERGIYVDTITLPFIPEGYYISYQRCCWSGVIDNILDAEDWGLTITTDIPGSNLISSPNSSARYNNYPPIVLCSGQTLDFDHFAFDPDGDSLVYSMCTPLSINVNDPAGLVPSPETSQPYDLTPWEVGFSETEPFGSSPASVVLDPQTGMMSITPNQLGTFVASVCVEEWRDGVLINMKSRTFGYRVVVCEVTLPMQVDVLGQGTLIEDCGSAGFIIIRDDTTDAIDLQVFISGTATNGVDFNFIPDTITLPAGVFTDTISLFPFLDGINEGDETVVFNIVVENVCEGTFDTTTAYITIVDYINMTIIATDSINICDEFGEWGELWCSVQNGVPPYGYYWEPLPYANNDTLTFPATDLNDNLNLFVVTVGDQCGKIIQSQEILVYNQCPLWMPNVITANGDNVNDFLIVGNLEDYDRVHLQIFNRWGNLLFETDDYQNDWKGIDKGGQPLHDGVYYYMVTPESDKFEYDDQQKTIYTAHGFFHIVR